MSTKTRRKYDRVEILSIKLRAATQLRRISRREFLSRLQVIRELDPIVDAAYKEVEDQNWREQKDDAPHGDPWHVSFHASQFPGDEMGCPRQLLYRMMDFAPEQPFNRHGRSVMSAGKAIEVELVRTWKEAGILLSADEEEEFQTGFELQDAHLTASVDAVLLPPRWNKPLPVEVKTKYQADIDRMKSGAQGPDQKHITQLKVQLAFVFLTQEDTWPGLDAVTHGFIYYLSRDRPSDTAEFRVDLDMKFFEAGVERLKQYRAFFEEGVLPSVNPTKKHPMGWRWSYPPCQWCDFKKSCKADHAEGITLLDESTGVQRTKKIRPDYDPEEARQRVDDRWEEPE